MALLKRLYSTKATRQHEAYQAYVKETKGKPMSFRAFLGKGPPGTEKPVKTVKPTRLRRKPATQTVRTKAVKSGLKRAGISDISAARKARERARRK